MATAHLALQNCTIERDEENKALSAEMKFFVFGATDESDALDAVWTAKSADIEGVPLQSIKLDERFNEEDFSATVSYKAKAEQSGGQSPRPSFSFDTTGGSQHITVSIATKGQMAGSADTQKAIGVDGEGIDIIAPRMTFSETHYFRYHEVDFAFLQGLTSLTGKTNNASYRGYNVGEVLFLGATGRRSGNKSSDKWEITYNFEVSPNISSLTVGDLGTTPKGGWEHLWVSFEKTESNGVTTSIPRAWYVEQIYESGDFSQLGIGDPTFDSDLVTPDWS